MLYGVIQDDACHSDSSQGIGHVNSCIREFAGYIHILLISGFAQNISGSVVVSRMSFPIHSSPSIE